MLAGGARISFASFSRLVFIIFPVISPEAVVRCIHSFVVLHFSCYFGWCGYTFYLHTVIHLCCLLFFFLFYVLLTMSLSC